ncbi:MAG: efflux RND transporter permease subunit [bacterium]
MLEKIIKLSVNHPKIVVFAFLIVFVVSVLQLPQIEINPNLVDGIPQDMPSKIRMERIEELFGGTEILVLALSDDDILNMKFLEKLKTISNELGEIEEVDTVTSLFTIQDIRGEEESLIIDDIVTSIPDSEKELEELRKKIKKNELIYGRLITEDFTSAAVIAVLKEDFEDQKLANNIDALVSNIEGDIYVAGGPLYRAKMGKYIARDLQKLVPLALFIMLLFLYFSFKRLRGVLLPFAVVIISTVFTFALIPLLGWEFHITTVILPMALIAITNDYGIHIIAHYQEKNQAGIKISEKELVYNVVSGLRKPIMIAGLTTIVGMLAFLSHILISAQQLGVLAAAGIAFALLSSLMFLPAVLTLLPRTEPLGSARKKDILEKLLFGISNFVSRYPVQIVIFSLLIILLISSGIFFLEVDTDQKEYFSPDDKIVKDSNYINDRFGGITTLSIVAEGDIRSPEVMKDIDEFASFVKEHEHVGEVTTISQIIRKMNTEIHGGGEEYDLIPDSKSLIAQYIMLFSSSGELEHLIDFEYNHALITASISKTAANDLKQVVDYVNENIEKDESPFVLVGGMGDLFYELVDAIVYGQIISLILAMAVVAVLLMIIFRSIKAGLILITPIILAILALFGMMGYLKIELNLITALLSSIVVGVGVDYIIHFAWRYREERKKSEVIETVKMSIRTTGRGITFNALSVIIGFIVLLFSSFPPVQYFGFMLVISIAACLFGALILLPAYFTLFDPESLK